MSVETMLDIEDMTEWTVGLHTNNLSGSINSNPHLSSSSFSSSSSSSLG